MSDARAIAGEYADLKFIKTRSVCQMVVEFPIEDGEEVVALFGAPLPGSPVKVAVARLKNPPARRGTSADDDRKGEQEQPLASSADAGHRSWDELPPAQQAGIRCNEKAFWKFLEEQPDPSDGTVPDIITDADKAADYLRLICHVKSRAELTTNSRARIIWNDLQTRYQTWLNDPVPA